MKNQRLWTIGAIVLATAGAVYYVYRQVKRTMKELDRREEENRTISQNLGLKEEDMNPETEAEVEDQIDYEINLPKRLFRECRFNAAFPIECVDTDYTLGCERNENGKIQYYSPKENVIHVTQGFDAKRKRNVLNFLFEIPLSSYNKKSKFTDGDVNIGEIIKVVMGNLIKEDQDDEESGKYRREGGFVETMKEIVNAPENLGFSITNPDTFIGCWKRGYFYLSYEERVDGEWVKINKLAPIEKNIWRINPFNREELKTVSDFVGVIRNAYEKDGTKHIELIAEDPLRFRNIVIEDAIMTIQVSFYMQDKLNICGINPQSATEILKQILDLEFEGKGDFGYRYFSFYNPEEDRAISVYDAKADENGNYFVESITVDI
jgi:hypothetical protein